VSAIPVRYHVEIAPVREILLLGTADLAFWQPRLQAEGLQPVAEQGRAQVMICAVAARFKGLSFRELSISILAAPIDDRLPQPGALLVQAFNSRPLFAFVERAIFHTPYIAAQIAVDVDLPASFQVAHQGDVVLSAQMACPPDTQRQPLRDGYDGWQGAIYLPSRTAMASNRSRLFFGKLVGQTQFYPFTTEDTVTIRPSGAVPVLGQLIDSGFAGQQWAIRTAATHGKSKTMYRERAVGLQPAPAQPTATA